MGADRSKSFNCGAGWGGGGGDVSVGALRERRQALLERRLRFQVVRQLVGDGVLRQGVGVVRSRGAGRGRHIGGKEHDSHGGEAHSGILLNQRGEVGPFHRPIEVRKQRSVPARPPGGREGGVGNRLGIQVSTMDVGGGGVPRVVARARNRRE